MSGYRRFSIRVGDSLDFEALVATKNDYKIIKDFGALYSDLFFDVIHGRFSVEYMNKAGKSKSELRTFRINGNNLIANLSEFCKISKDIFGYEARFNVDTNRVKRNSRTRKAKIGALTLRRADLMRRR